MRRQCRGMVLYTASMVARKATGLALPGAEFGKVAWSSGPLPSGNLVLSDDKLVILLETGNC